MSVIRTVSLLALVILGLVLAACHGGTSETGTLEGTVTIGPIWAVERPEGNPPVSSEVFEARKVTIYNQHRTKLIKEVDLEQIERLLEEPG